jgi:hypothetical protein
MALAVMQGNKPVILQKDQALALWEVLQGRQEPNEKQAVFCSKLERIYLNREYAPSDYLEMYPEPVDASSERELSWYQK